MRSIYLYILLFLLPTTLFSQKVVEKTLDVGYIEQLIVDGNDIYKIDIIASASTKIHVKAYIEGEYSENIVLQVRQEKGAVLVGTAFSPYFEKDNDKLAAHKVVSVALLLEIPEEMFVSVTSDIAKCTASGKFDFLFVSLEYGSCAISEFIGDADLQTTEGDITAAINPKYVSATAFSKYGAVVNNLPKGNTKVVEAYSIRGDITILETN